MEVLSDNDLKIPEVQRWEFLQTRVRIIWKRPRGRPSDTNWLLGKQRLPVCPSLNLQEKVKERVQEKFEDKRNFIYDSVRSRRPRVRS